MYIFKQKAPLKKYLQSLRRGHLSVGFVPTMGTLHQGHLTLIQKAKAETERVICSIFVNPTQFNDEQDLAKYPIQTDTDIRKLLEQETDILFLPEISAIYPEGLKNLEQYDFGPLETLAEGAHRPGHFQGVGQVLSRFLKIIEPDKMFMGQKDYQQLLITRKLVKQEDLEVEVVAVPIQRATDGLALSSRNIRLSEAARKIAPELYRTLHFVSNNLDKQPLQELLKRATGQLEEKGFKVEYLTLAAVDNLQPAARYVKTKPFILLAAAWLDGIRLIDNLFVNSNLS